MKYLSLLVFTTGAVTLGVELSAARLLEPAFGNSQIVWAALIGLILLYLAVGAWVGGRLADRFPHLQGLEMTITLAAVGVALIPLLSRPALNLAIQGVESFAADLLLSALLAVLLIFSIPVLLLGTVSPWAIRLAAPNLQQTGQTVGQLYAFATVGSVVGAFLPVLWLIPAYGTRWTFVLLAIGLLLVVTLGTLWTPRRWLPLIGLALVLALALLEQPGSAIRATTKENTSGQIIYEDESAYNYIVVRQWRSERHLKLNDGIGIHSIHHPDALLSQGIWDYFLLAPLFQDPTELAHVWNTQKFPAPLQNMLLIGLAAGTVSELYTNVYGAIPITGVELDPEIIAVGRQFFAMNQVNLTAIAADGRRYLGAQPVDARWDLVAIDAYRPPYIPFHLTTVEFFTLVRNHLTPRGIVAINVGRTAHNFALVDALAATLAQVFPTVYAIDEPGPPDNLSNSLVVATLQPTTLANLAANVAQLPAPLPAEFRQFAQSALPQARQLTPPGDAPIFTDDHAPVERVVHQIIVDFLQHANTTTD